MSLSHAPYRLFFPLGALLGAIGVGHWLLYTFELQEEYSGQGHALVQVQSFLLAFACGFLLTMIPRRMQTAGPSRVELVLLTLALVSTTFGNLTDRFWLSQVGYLVVLATLVNFVRSRIGQSDQMHRPPPSFLFVPAGLICGLVGGVTVLLQTLDLVPAWAMPIGRGLMQEGVFLCLILGLGHLLHPAIMGYAADPDAQSPITGSRLPYVLAAVLLAGSYPAAEWMLTRMDRTMVVRAVYGLRWLLVTIIYVYSIRAHRWPKAPGLNRRFIYIAFWMIPLGLLMASAMPVYRVAALHVMFVGGFSLLTFGISTHVIALHGGHAESVMQKPWQVWVFGSLFLFSMLTRVSADFLVGYWTHIEGAALAWIVAMLFWVVLNASRLRPKGGVEPEH